MNADEKVNFDADKTKTTRLTVTTFTVQQAGAPGTVRDLPRPPYRQGRIRGPDLDYGRKPFDGIPSR